MFKNKYILVRDVTLLCIVCNMLYWIFPIPPMSWRIGLVSLAAYTIIKEGNYYPCEKCVFVFVIFNLLHFFISFLWINPSIGQIGNILCALLSLSLFTCLSQKKVMTDEFFSIAGMILLIASIMRLYYTKQFVIAKMGFDEDMDITNNASTAFLMLIPMVFLVKNNIQKWIFLMVCIYFLLIGAKRGNLLAAILPMGLFVYYTFKSNRHSVIKTVLVIIMIIGASYITYSWIMTNDYLLLRIERAAQGSSSGRDEIYANAWHVWYNSNSMFVYLFGYGFDGTIHHLIRGMHAHNDWLEIIVDYGLVGVLIYLAVFVSLALQITKMSSIKMKIIVLSSVLIWFFKTLYSMGFTEELLSVMMISMGTALGYDKLENQS